MEKVLATLDTPNADIESTKFKVLALVSLSHFLNDSVQSLLVPTFPIFKENFGLNFTQIGLISLSYQITASLLQPLIGRFTDKRPQPYSLPVGMALTMCGLLLLSVAPTYHWILLGAAMLGTGSSVFHPESSRVARMASGGRFGLAQSIFQVGGNAGGSCGPLLAAAIIIPNGQRSLSWFAVLPIIGISVLCWVGGWAKKQSRKNNTKVVTPVRTYPRKLVVRTFVVLLILIFSKYFYIASISNYFIFYLMHKFDISAQSAQVRLFLFLFAMALGTLVGGPIGDRIGRKSVIWVSILGAAPFTLVMPYLNLTWTCIMIFLAGFILASAFSAIVVFAQELIPGQVGMVAGLFFGLSFGMGGLGAAVLGRVADLYGLDFVYHVCAFLPLLGIVAVFIPNLKKVKIE